MPYDPERHHRRSIRLHGYDYTRAGAYFVTICVHGRECLYGDVTDEIMRTNAYGDVVVACWDGLPDHFSGVALDAFVVMPNHVHGIIVLPDRPPSGTEIPHRVGAGLPRPASRATMAPGSDTGAVGTVDIRAGARAGAGTAPLQSGDIAPRQPPSLGRIMAYFKYQSTKQINLLRGTPGMRLWQRNYYDHIVRNDMSLQRIREYIANNPLQWQLDQLHPDNPSKW